MQIANQLHPSTRNSAPVGNHSVTMKHCKWCEFHGINHLLPSTNWGMISAIHSMCGPWQPGRTSLLHHPCRCTCNGWKKSRGPQTSRTAGGVDLPNGTSTTWGIIFIYIHMLMGGLEHVSMFSILGIIIPTDFHIFPRVWNHKPVYVCVCARAFVPFLVLSKSKVWFCSSIETIQIWKKKTFFFFLSLTCSMQYDATWSDRFSSCQVVPLFLDLWMLCIGRWAFKPRGLHKNKRSYIVTFLSLSLYIYMCVYIYMYMYICMCIYIYR